MASSPAPEMLAVLIPFLETFKRPDPGPLSGPLFGHIVMPPYAVEGVPKAIHDCLPVDRARTTFFYINIDERVECGDGEPSVETFSFARFLEILRRNICKGKGLWEEAFHPQDWLADRILPKRSVVVIQLSPQVSAQSALVLTCVVDRACASFPCDTRVLTMSSQRHHNFLDEMVSVREDVPDVRLCDLASVCAQYPLVGTHMSNARSMEQICEELYDAIDKHTTNSRLVLSFDDSIDDYLPSPFEDEGDERFERIHVFASQAPSQIFQLAQMARPGKTVVATVFSHFDHLPLIMDSFQELHLVLGRVDTTTPAWDNKFQQVLAYPHWTSKQDRMSQLWWAYQPEGVTVTVYSAKYTPEEFVKNGADHVRLVQGIHLGGYMAAALDLMSFDVGSEEFIAVFIQNPSIIEVIKNRLTLQTLISSRGLNLSSTEAKLFRTVLPRFNYDHRLAMLFSLDCDPAVRRFKAYFIATLVGGNICAFNNTEITLQKGQDVYHASRDYGSSLVRYGTSWVVLGLAKLFDASGDTSQLTGVAEFRAADVERVRNTFYSLLSAFEEHGLNSGSLPFEMPESGLIKDDKFRFHTDLFLAYMHQVSLCHRPTERNGGNQELEFKSLTSMQPCSFSLSNDVLSLLFNPQRILRQMGNEGWYGISHTLSRSSAFLTFHEWNAIPAEVVALWSEETGLTPSDLASPVVHQTSNSIEVTEESSDTV